LAAQPDDLGNLSMLAFRKIAPWARWLPPLIIFLMALAVRTQGLDRFVTPDEPLWIDRSRQFVGGLLSADYECPPRQGRWGRQFASQGWGCSFQTMHPGVTTMWGGGLGLLINYWQTARPSGIDRHTYLRAIDVSSLDPALLASARLPMAVAAAVFVLLYYILLLRLLDERIALVSTLLLALSSFHIALSRVIHHDAPNAILMVLSLLLMVGYWLQGWKRLWLLISGVLAGIAFLTKSVSYFMMPYAVMVGMLSLYYRWQGGRWRGRSDLWKLATDLALWGAAISTYQLAQEGHIHYFLGQISSDPGPLFYPIGWLLRASPLEVLGLLGLLIGVVAYFRSKPGASLFKAVLSCPVMLALAIFLVSFLLFMTVVQKKMVRYFLPAFPIISIFAATGLLWLADSLSRFVSVKVAHRWGILLLCGLILLVQGWLVLDNYPYYFTYFNPLLGGAPGAARLITVGWGEGMDGAATHLNQQPGAESFRVAAWYNETLNQFFVGNSQHLGSQTGEALQADYVVYYRNQLQRRLQNMEEWRYFDRYQTPVHRVTLQGLDYALIYRNPIQHHVPSQNIGQPNTLNLFGYNLAADGDLTLFWQNPGLAEEQELWAGLAPAGIENTGQDTHWLPCDPDPVFAAEATVPGTILESGCSLGKAEVPTGFYHLRLGLGDSGAIPSTELPTSQIAISVDSAGRFISSLAPLRGDELPQDVTSLDIPFGDMARMVGYRFEVSGWQPGEENAVFLYWQPLERFDSSLVSAFQVVLSLSSRTDPEPLLTMVYPVLPPSLALDDLRQGAVLPARYPLALPETLSVGDYSLDVCLTTLASETVKCFPLSITVNGP
jgi:hypothetical protein